MRAGKLDRRVTLQRKWSGHSDSGELQEVWVTHGASGAARPASMTSLLGIERYASEQFVGKEQVEFRLRWSPDIADLSPIDRLIYPASDAGESPIPKRSIYNIIDVGEIGRREQLRVVTLRQSDVFGSDTVLEGSGQAGGSG